MPSFRGICNHTKTSEIPKQERLDEELTHEVVHEHDAVFAGVVANGVHGLLPVAHHVTLRATHQAEDQPMQFD
jgi:hypothetical protein